MTSCFVFSTLLCVSMLVSTLATQENPDVWLQRLEASVTQIQESRKLMERQRMLEAAGRTADKLEEEVLVCEGDTAFLSCAAGFEVEVEAAELGWSGDGKMSEGICRPQHEQCVRSLAIEDLRQWRKLNNECDGFQSCSFPFSLPVPTSGCAESEHFNFLRIFYSCQAKAPRHEVMNAQNYTGFSVFAGMDQMGGGVINFSQIITNDGGHFSTPPSQFTCPVDGFYYFFINLQANMNFADGFELCQVQIKQDGFPIARAENDDVPEITINSEVMTSTSVVTRCPEGGVITVESQFRECFFFGSLTLPWSSFGGYFLAP